MVDFEVVKKIIKIAEDADISGLMVESEGLKVEVRREKGVVQVAPPVAAAPLAAPTAKAFAAEEEGIVAITAPMVGTFYRAPSPESPSYAEVGDKINPGKVVCIVEAMKLFNEIESEISGEIVKILVENAKPVEYGQKLMLVRKE